MCVLCLHSRASRETSLDYRGTDVVNLTRQGTNEFWPSDLRCTAGCLFASLDSSVGSLCSKEQLMTDVPAVSCDYSVCQLP